MQAIDFSKILWFKTYKMKMTTFFEEKSVVFFFFNGNMVHHKIVIPFQVTIAKVLIIVSYLNYQISV